MKLSCPYFLSQFLTLMVCAGLASGAVLLETDLEGSSGLPSGWTEDRITGSASWQIQSGGNSAHPSTAHGGAFNATLFSMSDCSNRLVSPIFWTEVYDNLSLTFWHAQELWPNDQDELKVLYSTNGGTNWQQLAHYTASIASWTERTITLPSASASSRIAFEGFATYGYGVCIDDIQVTGIATVALPAVSISATDASASEEGPDGGSWTAVRTGDTGGSVTVDYTLSGTATETDDYTLSHSGSISFAPGVTSVVVTLTAVDDSVMDEGDETVTLTLASGPGYEIGTASDTITIADNDVSQVQVLIVGSTHDSSERLGGTSAAFSPTAVATQLESILDAAGLGGANVTVRERYANATSILGQSQYAFNLSSWFHWPHPSGAETNRWADLRGETGTDWDYVILIPDPYTIENMPGLYAHGVGQIGEEVAKGPAETILLMSWPNGTGSSVAHYEEMVYRAGRSGGYKVAPAGLAWNTEGQPTGNNAAYLAAATIFSRIYGLNAKDTGYSYDSGLADAAYTTVTNAAGGSHYTGDISFQNPYLFNTDTERKIYWSSHGTSTEAGFNSKIGPAIARCKVGYESYNPWNNSWTAWTNNGGDTYWTEWSASWPTPIAWNHGRDPVTSEPYKGYVIEPSHWTFAFSFYYQPNSFSQPVDYANDHFVGSMFVNDYDMAKRMISEGNSGRNLPLRTMWAQIHKKFPLERPLRDGSGPHLNYYMDEAVGSFMYTLYSGRCPMDEPPADPDSDANWVARKIGYETAWELGRCQSRAPGFKVMPTAWNATNVTDSSSQTLSVQFMLAPTCDVTVAISTDDRYAGKVDPSALTFTPDNYSVAQTVTVTGATGGTGSFPFNVIVTTMSDDKVYDGLSDSWDFLNTRNTPTPAPAEIVVMGNGFPIASGDVTPDIPLGTDFGIVPVSYAQTFVISNQSSSTSLNLIGSPRVTLNAPGGHFTLSQDAASGSIAPQGATTFEITYTPLSGGIHGASVSIASDDANTANYTFDLTGSRPGPPSLGEESSTAISATSASVSGKLLDGVSANAWICWGDNDAGTTGTGSWDTVVSLGSFIDGQTFQTTVSGLDTNATYYYRCYVENGFGSDWSVYAVPFSGQAFTPVGGVSQPGLWFGELPGATDWTTPNPESQVIVDISSETGSIGGNTTEVMTGYIFDADGQISFTEHIDDSARIWIDGVLVLSNDAWSTRTWTTNLDLAPGWHSFEVRIGNAGGGSGAQGVPGIGFDPAGGVNWQTIVDSGDGSLLMTALPTAGIFNTGPDTMASSSSRLNAVLATGETNFSVYVHWGTSDGGSNVGTWANGAYVGSWYDTYTNLSYIATALTQGPSYYYTFRASNDSETVWASPSWTLMLPLAGQVTTNHSVPHAWLADQNTSWTSNYETAVMDDPDGDGFSTWEEYWCGTDPQVSSSHLRIDSVMSDGINVQLGWQHTDADVGIPPISIEATTNMLTGPWFRAGQKSPVNGANVWSEGATRTLFYRLSITDAP